VQFLAMTAGSRGVIYFAAPGFEQLADLTKLRAAMVPHTGAIRTAKISASASREKNGDPTGCGDVWGATYFSRLLAGETFIEAIGKAMVAAARNVDHKGATGLANHLRGELSVR
jgi:sugar/nucleoside kinase (ribokinase family)